MNVLLIMMMAAAAVSVLGQRTLAAGPADKETQHAASVPNLSGVWRRGGLPWYEPPASGPGPVTNRSRRNGVSNYKPTGRRLHQSDPATLGGGGRKEVRRDFAQRHHLSEPREPVLARTGAVHLQAHGSGGAAAAAPDHVPVE